MLRQPPSCVDLTAGQEVALWKWRPTTKWPGEFEEDVWRGTATAVKDGHWAGEGGIQPCR